MTNETGFVDVSAILTCGIYALVSHRRVVYIGQSRTMVQRISSHKGNRTANRFINKPLKRMTFDSVWVWSMALEQLDAMEQKLIEQYQPKYNVQHKPVQPPAVEELVKMIVGAQITSGPQVAIRRR